jgi:restriction endonuclease S subunit
LLYYREENDKEATGAIFRNLTTDQVSKFKIPVPPLDIQKEIVSELMRKFDIAKLLIDSIKSQLIGINRLPTVLLRQAFSGAI